MRTSKRRLLLVALVGVFMAGLALPSKIVWSNPPQKVDKSESAMALRVRVVEEGHPDPGVPNASVGVWRRYGVKTGYAHRHRTGADGRATIPRIVRTRGGRRHVRWAVDADHYLEVTASGFTRARRTVAASERAEGEIVIALSRGTFVAGTIREADGTFAKGVQVHGEQSEQPEQWYGEGAWQRSTTDSNGRFRLSGLHPGRVSLKASFQHGDGVWVGNATVEAGATGVEIRLPKEPARRRIRLLVKGHDGRPLAHARWRPADWLGSRRRRNRGGRVEDGEAILPADPDMQWITLSYPGDRDIKAFTTVVGPLGTRGGDLEVVMPRGHVVSGTVRDEQGETLYDVSVVAKPIIAENGIERVAASGMLIVGSDLKGRFRFEGLPSGRVEISAPLYEQHHMKPIRVNAPFDSLNLVLQSERTFEELEGNVRHQDGTPAPAALVYALDRSIEQTSWAQVRLNREGKFSVTCCDPKLLRLRVGLSPSGVEDMAASETTPESVTESKPLVLTVPPSRRFTVQVHGWPAAFAGRVRLANGPHSRGVKAWIFGDTANFKGVDPSAPLSIYCGPLPDGRIAFARNVSAAVGKITLSLIPSRTIRGKVRVATLGAEPYRVWADSSEFEATGRLGSDGSFVIRGVPNGACRVCVVYKRGKKLWVGSVVNKKSSDPVVVDLEARAVDETDLDAWMYPRPPP